VSFLEPDQAQPQPTTPVYGVVVVLVSAALAMFALFLVDVAADLLPPQPLDPLWLLRAATALVNALSIPVVGVLFLHLAAALAPLTDLGQLCRTWASRVATWLALVFLLLLPLLGFATWRGISNVQAAVNERVELVNRNADRVRAAIRKASTPKELQLFMVAEQGPSVSAEEFNTPLPTLKKSKLLLVKQIQSFYTNQIPGVKNKTYEPIFIQTLRTTLLALAGSAGFAALVWNPKRQQSLLRMLLDYNAKINAKIAYKFRSLKPVSDDKGRNSRLMQKSRNTKRQTLVRNQREIEQSERERSKVLAKFAQGREKKKKKELDRQKKLNQDRKN